jgi:5-methylcytosine-specific restriction endonuclease McrA
MVGDVLVLNPDAMPLSVFPLSTTTWQEAISAVYRGQVEVIHNYETWAVHSPSVTMPVPSVVMMHEFVSIGRYVKFCKANVYLRDQYTCQYCDERFEPPHGLKSLTWDHVIPKTKGGTTRWDNMATACADCNFAKGHGEHMKPKNKPRKPTYFELVELKKNEVQEIADPIWNYYLQWPEDRLKLVNRQRAA